MKKVFIAMAAIAAMASSCTKEEIVKEEIPLQESEVHISFVNDVFVLLYTQPLMLHGRAK